MSKFDDYVRSITGELDLPPRVMKRIRDEAMSHLEDERCQCLAEGMSEEASLDVAIERFGRQEVIARMVRAALAERQSHYRRWRRTGLALAVGLLFLLGIGIGAWFNFFDDAVSGSHTNIPRNIKSVVYLGAEAICLAVLVIIASTVFRVKWFYVGSALVVVVVAFWCAMYFCPHELFVIHSGERVNGPQIDWAMMGRFFLMRLYLCWVPLLVTAPLILLVRRTRGIIRMLTGVAAIGLLSGLLWGIEYGNFFYTFPWLVWMKWPKMLSTGLLAVVFMLLIGTLGRALQARFQPDDVRLCHEPEFTVIKG